MICGFRPIKPQQRDDMKTKTLKEQLVKLLNRNSDSYGSLIWPVRIAVYDNGGNCLSDKSKNIDKAKEACSHPKSFAVVVDFYEAGFFRGITKSYRLKNESYNPDKSLLIEDGKEVFQEKISVWNSDESSDYENNCDDRPSLRQLRGNFW